MSFETMGQNLFGVYPPTHIGGTTIDKQEHAMGFPIGEASHWLVLGHGMHISYLKWIVNLCIVEQHHL